MLAHIRRDYQGKPSQMRACYKDIKATISVLILYQSIWRFVEMLLSFVLQIEPMVLAQQSRHIKL